MACTSARRATCLNGVLHQALEVRWDPDRLQPGRQVARELGVDDGAQIATPKTAPISRLVLVAEAAMPDRSGGTTVSGTDVTGTSSMPMPMPGQREDPAQGAEVHGRREHDVGHQDAPTRQEAPDRHGPAWPDARHQADR